MRNSERKRVVSLYHYAVNILVAVVRMTQTLQKSALGAMPFGTVAVKQHQVQDYARHKAECKFLSKQSHLEFKPYSTVKELEKFPLGSSPRAASQSRCFICHSHADEVNLGRTPCCNLPVCNNEFEYKPCSYSRDYCMRSHAHYTKCHTHFDEEHEGSDWRECDRCNCMEKGNVRPYALTNGFNYSPALHKYIPRGSFLTHPCDGCKNRIMPGHDSRSSITA